MKIKKSKYRQSGYLNLKTNETEEFYGGEVPQPAEDYRLIWDNMVSEVITITPVSELPVGTQPADGVVP